MEEIVIFLETHLPKIIAGCLFVVTFIIQWFLKKFMEKITGGFKKSVENKATEFAEQFDKTEKRVNSTIQNTVSELNAANKELEKAKKELKSKDKQITDIKEELNTVFKMLKIVSLNSKELVQNGYATEIGKIIEQHETRKEKGESNAEII